MQKKQPKFRISLATALVVAVICGFVAGIVGELWINQFLAPEIQFKNYRDLSQRLDDLSLKQQRELKDILSEQDFSINKVIDQIQPKVVTIYNTKQSSDLVKSIYLNKDALGSGFILTSDGWLVTSKQVIADVDDDYSVAIDGSILVVEKIVEDIYTDAVFFKVAANNLPVVDLTTKNQLQSSQTVLLATTHDGVVRTTIEDLYYFQAAEYAELVHSSERFYRYILLNQEFNSINLGAPVFALNGKVIGILIHEKGLVLPIDYFSQVIKSAVQDNAPKRVYLGVNYLDLQTAVNFDHELQKGALLISDAGKAAVVKNSPAAKAGLKANDVVIKVENEEVNRFHSLTQLINEYQIDDEVELTIVRDEKEQNITVKLMSLQN